MSITRRLHAISFCSLQALRDCSAGLGLPGRGDPPDRLVAQEDVPRQLQASAMELNMTRSSLQLRHAMVRTPEELAAPWGILPRKSV